MALTTIEIKNGLRNWNNVNTLLRTATEKDVARMLQAERHGRCRLLYLLRIHGRLNVMRYQRERKELVQVK
jgi:hypothetical protein